MGFLTFIGWIVILVLVLNLRNRVKKLERSIKDDATQRAFEPSYQLRPQQLETQQPTTSDSLVDYIRQQLKQGTDREEIKN